MSIKIKLISVIFYLYIGINCNAQTVQENVRALQGEWISIHIQDGNIITDLVDKSQGMEIIWRFDGNNFISIIKLFGQIVHTRTGTFALIGDILVTTTQGEPEASFFLLERNILTITQDEFIITFQKQ